MRKLIGLFAVAALLAAALTACGIDAEQNRNDNSASDNAEPGQSENAGNPEESNSSEEEGSSEEDSEGATQKILDAIKQAYGDNYLPNTEIPEDVLSSMYGLDPDSYTEVAAEMPMISAHVDTVIIVKAASGKTGDVQAALTAYHDGLVADSIQYPVNVAKVNAARIVANGDYVAFIMLGQIDEREDASDSQRAEFAEEQVQIGVDAFNGYFD